MGFVMGRPPEDYTKYIGLRFGKLIVKSVSHKNKYSIVFMEADCDCGGSIKTSLSGLKKGRTVSCGCHNREKSIKQHLRHGKTGTRLHYVWLAMKDRCNNERNKSFKNYGGRGITVCEEWQKSYESFESWALSSGYKEGLSIDRIDNNKGYCPENCRMTDNVQQARNKRNTVIIDFDGSKKSLQELAEEKKVSVSKLRYRIKAGWDINKALASA